MMHNGLLIDGRNRLAACKLAKSEAHLCRTARTRKIHSADPVLPLDDRRNITKGQRAMAKAMRYPDLPQRGKSGPEPTAPLSSA